MAAHREFAQIEWDETVREDCRQLIRLAVREDLRRGQDWTTVALVPAEARGAATIVAREAGVLCGLPAALLAVEEMHTDLTLTCLVEDRAELTPGLPVARLEGSARDLLTTERIVLNLLGHLSGIASLTRQFVQRIQHTNAKIYDTRKTTPGWRSLEKYATRCGGAQNHRRSLADAILIKDNHLAWWSENPTERPAPTERPELGRVLQRVRSFLDNLQVEVPVPSDMILEIEVDTMRQLREVLPEKPDIVLLDNMSPEQLREAVALRDELAPETQLEASGGIRLDTIAAVAESGVDRISVGALTHSARSLDLGLDWHA